MPTRRTSRESTTDGVIAELRPKASDPNLRQVRVDGKTVATLRAADVESLGLQVGDWWTPTVAARVNVVIAVTAARKIAMNLLSKRGYSRSDLIARLIKRGCDAEHAQTAADQMEHDGWLNERAYAEDVVQAALRKGPAAAAMLADRLARRSIKADVAGEAIAAAAAGQDERQAALELATRRFAVMKGLPKATATRRLAGLLARRGFDDALIGDTLEALGLGADAQDT